MKTFLIFWGVLEMKVFLEATWIEAGSVPCGEKFKLAKSQLFPKALGGRKKVLIMIISFIKEIICEAQVSTLSSTSYLPFYQVYTLFVETFICSYSLIRQIMKAI